MTVLFRRNGGKRGSDAGTGAVDSLFRLGDFIRSRGEKRKRLMIKTIKRREEKGERGLKEYK